MQEKEKEEWGMNRGVFGLIVMAFEVFAAWFVHWLY